MRFAILCLVLLLASISTLAQEPTGLRMLGDLAGTWRGTSSGEPGEGKVERDCTWILRERFLQCTNRATYPPTEKKPKGEIHEDVAIFSYDKGRKAIRLRQFHVEGFVNDYVATHSEPGIRHVFTSEAIENIPAGWQARETYDLKVDSWSETFELAPPGGELAVYSKVTLARVK